MPHDPLLQVEELLAQGRHALLNADFELLPALGAATQKAVAMLDGRADAARLHRLRTRAEDNARLANAAADGIRAARARLAALLSPEPLATYDNLGRRTELPASAPSHERRA